MVSRLYAGDASIPAGRVRREHSLMLADSAAAGHLGSDSKAATE
jgi:hypothetical protein